MRKLNVLVLFQITSQRFNYILIKLLSTPLVLLYFIMFIHPCQSWIILAVGLVQLSSWNIGCSSMNKICTIEWRWSAILHTDVVLSLPLSFIYTYPCITTSWLRVLLDVCLFLMLFVGCNCLVLSGYNLFQSTTICISQCQPTWVWCLADIFPCWK